ncbi:MAG TPA: hypothetical protein VGS19_21210 [Streptosporangiaceae bacterium]|nr:hypothetical protein [Streptosporangiaceae bacterium]
MGRVTVFGPREIYLGWQYALVHPAAGLPPRRPVPPQPQQVDAGWLVAQRREEARLSRPAWAGAAVCLTLTGLTLWLGSDGQLDLALTGLGVVVFAALAGLGAAAVWRGWRGLRADVAAEALRVEAVSAAQYSELFAAQEEHARRYRTWQASQDVYAGQPQWYPVALPDEMDRVDVVGGTLAGWSALFTTVAVPRLAAGAEVTVVDLSEGAVAKDLVSVAHSMGVRPLVWVLPADLGRFDLGVGLSPAELADVLTATASASTAPGDRGDVARDHSLLARVCEVFGDGVEVAQVTAGLRALGQVGDPREDIRAGVLTAGQLERLNTLFGRGAVERVVIERAWALEARLRMLEHLGRDPAPLPRSRLRVVAAEAGAGGFGGVVVGTYVAVSLTHLLRQARPGQPWRHTLCLAGAERLDTDVLDRLTAACESTRTGLVLAFRTAPAHVRERLGRGNAALAVMRLGNAEDAKAVSEQIGAEHRFVVSQLTDTVGASVTDTAGDSYTSTVGTADSWSGSESVSTTSGQSQGSGQSRADPAPFGGQTNSRSRDVSRSHGTTGSESVTAGINTSTSWGWTTSRAVGGSESLARTSQRSREFLVEAHELQQLPPSAVIVSYGSRTGRTVVLADANPAIMALPTVTLRSPEEVRQATAPRVAPAGSPPPNLGPPPQPQDWRKRRRR